MDEAEKLAAGAALVAERRRLHGRRVRVVSVIEYEGNGSDVLATLARSLREGVQVMHGHTITVTRSAVQDLGPLEGT